MTITTISNILIIIGVIWCISGYFTYMQTVKINNILHMLDPLAPRLYSGKNAGFMRTRRIIFAATRNDGIIVEARYIKAAFIFKPAKEFSFEQLKGKNVFTLNPSSMNLEPVMEKALKNLIKDARNRNR